MIDFRRVKMRNNLCQCLGIRNLIHIAENDDILRLTVSHRPYQLIFLKFIPFMSRYVHRGIFYRHI